MVVKTMGHSEVYPSCQKAWFKLKSQTSLVSSEWKHYLKSQWNQNGISVWNIAVFIIQ